VVIETQKTAYVKPPQRRGHCGKWTITQERPDGSVCISPLYCESLNCPACRLVKLAKLAEKLGAVDVTQYIDITFAHRYAEVKREIGLWLRFVKRQYTRFEYLMVIGSRPHVTRIAVFFASGFMPQKWIEESLASFGLEASADTKALYNIADKGAWIAKLVNEWAADDTFIHRVSHSRKFYVKAQPSGPPGPKARMMVNRIPLAEFLEWVTGKGFPIVQLLPDVYLIPASVIGDRGVKPFDLLFPGLAPPGTSNKRAR